MFSAQLGVNSKAANKISPRVGEKKEAPAASGVAHPMDLDAPKVYLKPEGQIKGLSETQLNEEFTTILTANNPNAPKNIARYSYKERAYKFDPTVEQVAFHFAMDGYLIHKDSEDAKRQAMNAEAGHGVVIEGDEGDEVDEGDDGEGEAGADGAAGAEAGGHSHQGSRTNSVAEDDDLGLGPGSRPLRNQFNFSERATQTFHNQSKDRETLTEPPPNTTFSATTTQWEIFDAYMEDIERNRTAKEKAGKKGGKEESGAADVSDVPQPEKRGADDIIYSKPMASSLKIMERLVNQNTYDEILQDYKYYEDISDNYKDADGTLLPLWKFANEKVKKKHVTSMCWNHEYTDLFAVGYGSYDFMKQGTGAICCYTLKNACNYPEASHPEFSFTTESGVTCLDFHPQHSSLLAVGLYDGTVLVFDVRQQGNLPIFQSTAKTGKHTDPVWQVYWQEEDIAKNLNFFSISSDGRVTLWTLSKNELQYTDVLHLKMEGGEQEAEQDDEAGLSGLAGGCCFSFNRFSEHLFLVGTEEGKLHKCSKAYNSQYLQTYDGHYMNVYRTAWNPFHPKIFISASADWTVKVWDHTQKQPLMSFDLNNAVGDVAWAPYSSTVFAAVTDDGKVHVFDLDQSKHEPMCEQQVVRKAKLTQVCFNPNEPVLLVGDDRGNVTSLKLSPNLRKVHAGADAKPAAGAGRPGAAAAAANAATAETPKDFAQRELEVLERVLSLTEKSDSK